MPKKTNNSIFKSSGISLISSSLLLLAFAFLLGGCGLAQLAALSSSATENKEYIPEKGSREDIMLAAAKHPDAALLSPAFYKVAAPVDVAMVLQKVNPTQITQSAVADRFPDQFSGVQSSGFGSTVAMGMLLPAYKLETYTVAPLPVALEYSNHPEVISMLAEAGCPMHNSVATYLGPPIAKASSRYLPLDPEILAVLLRYEPTPKNSSFILSRLLSENDEIYPPDAVKVFLKMTRNLNISDDRGFVINAVKSGSMEKLQLILAAGANPNYCHSGNESALALARKAGRQDMVKALLAAGAKKNIPAAETARP